jgi:hypothetical protein
LLWFKHHLIFVLVYSKVTTGTGKDWVIIHGLPWELTELILIYVVLVQPLVVIFVRQLYGQNHADIPQDLLFSQHNLVLTPYKFSLQFKALMNQYLGTKVNVSEWRHLIIAIMRKHFHLEVQSPDKEEDDMDDLELQSGHTAEMGKHTYGLLAPQEWNSLQADTALKWVNASQLAHDWILRSKISSLPLTRQKQHWDKNEDEADYVPKHQSKPSTPVVMPSARCSSQLKALATSPGC